ncbi:MAG: SDR family NAD(P)-dependent oxidoreductase [Dehalococcoidia bacterium]|nr:SDR family NAD(P)-dependent oxidoreductase [Dehalococcoidia bacterium]MSQ34692.1 SDR family NAD(P)-dependent oxidoreductase [Dehalococcoidia bacterium]
MSSDLKPLSGRTVLITGAAGGLGSVARDVFAAAGATLIRERPGGHDTAWEWFDATDPAAARAAVDRAVADYGHIDVLVNLVGTWAPQPQVADMPDETLDKLMAINFRSAFIMCRAVLPHMVSRKWGRIINIGAKQGIKGTARNSAYGASKAAVIALTESIAEEVSGRGITANVIIPSTIDTPANRKAMPDADFSKWVPPHALAEAMVFLCTESGGNINGARIPIWNRS